MNQTLRNIVDVFVIVFATLIIIGFFLSDVFIFRAKAPSYTDNSQIIKLTTTDGTKISALYFPTKGAEYTVLVSHGNGDDIGRTQYFAKQLNQHGFSAMVYDYYGYGSSQGHPTEENTYLAADTVYNFLTKTQNIPPRKIIAYGHSLGSGVATYIASKNPVAALVLDGAFLSAFRVVTVIPILPFDKFRTANRLPNIHIPMLFIHGREDDVIPFWHGVALYNMAKEPKLFLWVDGAKHTDVRKISGDTYWSKWTELVASIKSYAY